MSKIATDDEVGQQDALRDVSVLNEDGMKYGLPAQLLYGGLGLTLTFLIMLPWWVGPLFAAIYFTAMYEIHKDDAKALSGWLKAATRQRKEVWIGGRKRSRNIYYIDN
jgi:hypothetical protein